MNKIIKDEEKLKEFVGEYSKQLKEKSISRFSDLRYVSLYDLTEAGLPEEKAKSLMRIYCKKRKFSVENFAEKIGPLKKLKPILDEESYEESQKSKELVVEENGDDETEISEEKELTVGTVTSKKGSYFLLNQLYDKIDKMKDSKKIINEIRTLFKNSHKLTESHCVRCSPGDRSKIKSLLNLVNCKGKYIVFCKTSIREEPNFAKILKTNKLDILFSDNFIEDKKYKAVFKNKSFEIKQDNSE